MTAFAQLIGLFGLASPGTMMSRVAHGVATTLSAKDFQYLVMSSAIFDLALFGLGVSAGLYRWEPMPNARALGWSAAYVGLRSVLEELVFRTALLPHPKVDGMSMMRPSTFALHCIAPVIVFALSHALTTQRKPDTVLSDRFFLMNAVTIGVACSWAYWLTNSYWGAALMHWVIVFPWVVLLGGHKATHTPPPIAAGARPIKSRNLEPSGVVDTGKVE